MMAAGAVDEMTEVTLVPIWLGIAVVLLMIIYALRRHQAAWGLLAMLFGPVVLWVKLLGDEGDETR